MNKSNIHQFHTLRQDTREGVSMNQAKDKIIHSIIREYGEYSDDSYDLDVRIISHSDKKLLVSYFCDSEELEFAHTSVSAGEAVFNEYLKPMQKAIDDECFAVYRDRAEEIGLCMNHHSDNNEIYWVRN